MSNTVNKKSKCLINQTDGHLRCFGAKLLAVKQVLSRLQKLN